MSKIGYWRVKYVYSFPEEYQQVFDYVKNLSPEYIREASLHGGGMLKNGAMFQANYTGQFTTITDGERYTVGTPDVSEHTVFLLGPSYVYGAYCGNDGTITSHLQGICNENMPGKYVIRNFGLTQADITYFRSQIMSLPIKKDDIAILIWTMGPIAHNIEIWKFIKELDVTCSDKMSKFCVFAFPRVGEIINPSLYERKLSSNSLESLYKRTATSMDAIFPEKYVPCDTLNILTAESCCCFDLQHCINRPHSQGEIFVDPWHLCSKGYLLFAEYIYANFLSNIKSNNAGQKYIDGELPYAHEIENIRYNSLLQFVESSYSSNNSINEWLAEIAKTRFEASENKKIGSTVMNCNPFTFGHRFLIEEASKDVDYLYIFLVEEDRSDFSFSDRLEMVLIGIADLENRIKVIPSGQFIISSFTFPEYFGKIELADVSIDATTDVLIFGSIIAKNLNISMRFVGKEPYCNVRRQYNAAMKRILPYAGIAVKEISRLEFQDKPISASRVRQLYKDKKFYEIENFVPLSTIQFLQNRLFVDLAKAQEDLDACQRNLLELTDKLAASRNELEQSQNGLKAPQENIKRMQAKKETEYRLGSIVYKKVCHYHV